MVQQNCRFHLNLSCWCALRIFILSYLHISKPKNPWNLGIHFKRLITWMASAVPWHTCVQVHVPSSHLSKRLDLSVAAMMTAWSFCLSCTASVTMNTHQQWPEINYRETLSPSPLLLSLYRCNLLAYRKSMETSGANLDHLMSIWPWPLPITHTNSATHSHTHTHLHST